MSQPSRRWSAHACYRYDLFNKQTDLTVLERETLLRTPPPKIPDVVVAFLDNDELLHKTDQERRHRGTAGEYDTHRPQNDESTSCAGTRQQ
jgi:hypothetical protein